MKKLIYGIVMLCLSLFITSAVFAKTNNAPGHTFDEGVKIKLILGGKTYDLQSYSLSYFVADKQKAELSMYNYQTNAISMGMRSSKVDPEFIEWLINPAQQPKDGQIILTDAESGKIVRTINLTGVTTFSYTENNFNPNYNTNQITNFSLKYKAISIKF